MVRAEGSVHRHGNRRPTRIQENSATRRGTSRLYARRLIASKRIDAKPLSSRARRDPQSLEQVGQTMGGVPCLRGLRIPVATIVALVAEGQTQQETLALYPDLEAEDIREALLFAAEAVRERALPVAAGE